MARDCPIGFRFRPTEEELITLLWFKATNQQQHITNVVPEKKLYGVDASPWKIFADDDVCWELYDDSGKKRTKRVTYVVTKQSKMSPKKVARTAGCGTWEGQSKGQDISNSRGEIIGSMKMLSYVLNSGSPREGGWIMHEYSLAGSLLDGIGSTDYVVCRITIDDEKYTNVKKVAAAQQGVNQAGSMRSTKKPKVLGKRSEPNSVQQSSNPSKKQRSDAVEEEISINAAADLAMGIGTDGATETPNSLNNYEEFVISPQAIMSDELIGVDGQTSCRDVSVEEGTQSVNLTGGSGDGFGLDDGMVQFKALLDGILIEDDGLVQPEVALPYSEQSFDHYQQAGEISYYPYSEMVLVEEVQSFDQYQDAGEISDYPYSEMVLVEEAQSFDQYQDAGEISDYPYSEMVLVEEAQSFDQYQDAGEISDYPYSEMVLVEEVQSFDQYQDAGEISDYPYSEMVLVEEAQSFDQYQDAGEISDYPYSEMVLVEEVQTQFHDPIDCSVPVMARDGSGEEEHLQPVGTLDLAANAEQPAEAESSEEKLEVPSDQTPPHSDSGDDRMTCQAMVDEFFSDEFLPLSGGDDEDIYAQPISATDEWFQGAMQCWGAVQ